MESAYFLGDALGSVRQLIDEPGVVTLTRSYNPYGNEISNTGSGETDYSFTGEWTSSTNLLYLRARHYDSSRGRFISKDTWQGIDTIPLSYNGWVYGNSNPVMNTDHSGFMVDGSMDNVPLLYNSVCRVLTGEARITCEKLLECRSRQKQTISHLTARKFGVMFSGDGWQENELQSAVTALQDVGRKLASIVRGSEYTAFKKVYRTDERNLYLNKGYPGSLFFDPGCEPGSGGMCTTNQLVQLNSDRSIYARLINYTYWTSNSTRLSHNFIHEFGHLLNLVQGGRPYYWMLEEMKRNELLARPDKSQNYGFAGTEWEWQMAVTHIPDRSEIFADQYMGWVYDKWEWDEKTGGLTDAGKARADFMDKYMPIILCDYDVLPGDG